MALIDLSGFETIRDLTNEVRGCRVALESIARSLLSLTEIPAAPPGPDKPAGPEAVSSYATALMEMEGEDADALRQRLRAAGMTDEAIERQIIDFFMQGQRDEERTDA